MSKRDPWRNRIVGEGEEAPDQLLANPKNFRIHPKPQQDALSGALNELGWIQRIVVNQRSGHVIDGHLRVSLAISRNEPSVPVVYVDLSPEEESLALLTLDPIAAMAATEASQLDALLRDVQTGEAGLQAMLDQLAQDAGLYQADDSAYSRKIEPPIYEPTGPKPTISELFDDTKTQRLIQEIQGAEGLTDDERRFLAVAAQRHTVLHFGKIAEYYAHSSKSVQALMENSALVIIDFERAIELGFVELTKKLSEQVKDEYGE